MNKIPSKPTPTPHPKLTPTPLNLPISGDWMEFKIKDLIDLITIVLSWTTIVLLLDVLSGYLLTMNIPFRSHGKINLKFIRLSKTKICVGFGAHISVLCIAVSISGNKLYPHFVKNFGINLGKFNSLILYSSIGTVFISFLVALLFALTGKNGDPIESEHTEVINRLAGE
jgi:hypothetical protein